jgi:hypothetical protein
MRASNLDVDFTSSADLASSPDEILHALKLLNLSQINVAGDLLRSILPGWTSRYFDFARW